nr:hypothetical protein Q903MT_gene4942 [Picea sitchensis]
MRALYIDLDHQLDLNPTRTVSYFAYDANAFFAAFYLCPLHFWCLRSHAHPTLMNQCYH